MDSLVDKDIIEDGESYLAQLQHDDYGHEVAPHPNVLKDDRDKDTITSSRNKSTQQHHSWKGEEYKGQPKGGSISKTDDVAAGESRPKFVSNPTHYSTTDRDASVSVNPGN